MYGSCLIIDSAQISMTPGYTFGVEGLADQEMDGSNVEEVEVEIAVEVAVEVASDVAVFGFSAGVAVAAA